MRRCPRSCASAATPPIVEGWALYAETLGDEMGFSRTRISASATLNDEMLRAMRLVVDTGIHAKGWTREQAIDYMLANSGMGRTDVTAEVERYIAIPSQALAYKIGALTIQRLARQGRGRARRQVRHPRVPRAGADDRRAAAADPGAEDRRLDRGEEGVIGRRAVAASFPLPSLTGEAMQRSKGSAMRGPTLIAGLFAGLLAGCAARPAPDRAASAAEAPRQTASQALAALFRDSDEASLRRNPIQATARGDLRYADRLGDFFSDAYYDAEREAAPGGAGGARRASTAPR